MIELLNVCKFIKGREVLRDVSLSIESGEVVGIKGANGSGKTMLLRAIAGLIYPTSGSVVVDGENPNPLRFLQASAFSSRTRLFCLTSLD